MTLIADRGRDGPRVHVLAIGVGSYRHLPGGVLPVPHDTLGLRQLSGPPVSARLFVEWATTRLNHPSAALGTVELLTSPGEPAGDAPALSSAPPTLPSLTSVEVPTLANVQSAFERWYAACDTDEGNVGIFYFCGHGVEREQPFLLLEDFGRSSLALLENAIDIGQTYQGLARNRAREQYLFVDACREIPFRLMEELSGNAKVLVTPKLQPDRRRDTALVFATSGGSKAYGKAGQPTQFTRALVRGLDGLGARSNGPPWLVDVPGLQRAITQQLRGDDQAPPQLPSIRGAGVGILNTLTSAPVVPVTLACRPPTAIPGASLTVSALTGAAGFQPLAVPQTQGWKFEVPAGIYTLTVDFPGGPFPPKQQSVPALPPGLLDWPVDVGS